MKVAIALASVAALGLVGASSLEERAIEERAITCSSILPSMNADLTNASNFCRQYLVISPKTVTRTSTTTRATVTVTQAVYTTTVLPITPDPVTTTGTRTNKKTITVTPSTKTVTSTVTSTAYLDADGNTIAIQKRAAPSPVELAARAITTPSYLKSLSKTDIKAACVCLQLTTPTYTYKKTVAATATATKVLNRKIIKTTTLAPVVVATTVAKMNTITVTAAAPLSTVIAYEIDPYNGCPPDQDTAWVCPDQTDDDDGSDPNFETCAVETEDGYSGNCVYWSDDGSPAGSTLTIGDGSGDSDYDQTRDAVYGDDPDDDCPSWADWTCSTDSSAAANAKRSTLERASAHFEFEKRGYVPKRVSVAQHRKNGKSKMPKGLKRGGKYVNSA